MSCSEGQYLDGGTCADTCSVGTYATEERVCDECNLICLTCSGPTPNDCLACEDDLLLLDGQCVETCPDGLVGDTTSNSCVECDSSCVTCSGSGASDCTSCHEGGVLTGGECVCEDNFSVAGLNILNYEYIPVREVEVVEFLCAAANVTDRCMVGGATLQSTFVEIGDSS